jgi:tRNA threonylcarbamoyladenosine modification (KEOPS) complex Cgi121 subunit
MAPLTLYDVIVDNTPHQVGIFGCTRATSLQPTEINTLTQQVVGDQDITIVLADADFIAGAQHLLFATIHALTAFSRQTNRATTKQMEILRFAAAKRQISHALNLLGISKSTRRFAGVLVNSTASALQSSYEMLLELTEAKDNAKVLKLTTSKKAKAIQEIFQITADELRTICPASKPAERYKALQKLVFERCALQAISR